jgi:hypothetical protein
MKNHELLDSFETVDRSYRFFRLPDTPARWNISYTVKETSYVDGSTFRLKRDAKALWDNLKLSNAKNIINKEFDNLVFRG